MLLVYGVVAALILSYLTGGRGRYYLQRPLKGIYLPIAAFMLEALCPYLEKLISLPVYDWLWLAVLAQYMLLFIFCGLNLKRRPIWLVTLACALNFLVISLNGFRMPVAAQAADMPNLMDTVSRIQSGQLFEYVMATADTKLLFLGDVIPIPFINNGLASIGDLVLTAGLVWLIFECMGPAKTPKANEKAQGSLNSTSQ